MPAFTIVAGKPGETWTNTGSKVQFQFICSFVNSCGQCIQYANQIGPWWPLPIHRRCSCRNQAVLPGQTSDPFVDYVAEVRALDPAQQARVMGRSNWRLVESGKAEWGDIVTPQRIRNFREVVKAKGLTVKELTKVGIRKDLAETAYAVTHSPEITQAERTRAALLDLLKAKGVDDEAIRARVARSLARRVGIAGGPSSQPPPTAQLRGRIGGAITTGSVSAYLGARLPLTMQTIGEVPDLARMEEVVRDLPESVHRALAKNGVRIDYARRVTMAVPEIAGEVPRGWQAGMTWDNADGFYDWEEKRIVVASHVVRPDTGGLAETTVSRRIGVMRHEVGHAFDHALGTASETDAFREAYNADVAGIADKWKGHVSYLLQPGTAGRSEAFAEVFGSVNGGGSGRESFDAKQFFPRVAEHIKGLIGVKP